MHSEELLIGLFTNLLILKNSKYSS
ncbi:uncharacterized protein METZ01_LOCUS148235, partial [marine metagenome]